MKDRTKMILNRLIESDLPIKLEALSNEFSVSDRTIRNEVNEINFILDNLGLPLIKNIRSKGLRLQIQADEKLKLYQYITNDVEKYYSKEERTFDLILSIGFSQEKVLLYEKENQYLVSKSTMDEDMRKIRAQLESYDINIISDAYQGMIFVGNEHHIRTFLQDMINRSISHRYIYKNESGNKIDNILNKYISKDFISEIDEIYTENISDTQEDIYREQLLLFIAICIKRLLNNAMIRRNNIFSENDEQNEYDIRIEHFVKGLFQKFIKFPVDVQETKYIKTIINKLQINNDVSLLNWSIAQILTVQLIQYIEANIGMSLNRKNHNLQYSLYKHIEGLLSRMKYNIQVVNPLKEMIKKKYYSVYELIENFSPKFTKFTKKSISDDEIAFLTIHFSTMISEINQNLSYKYEAVVICNHGVATGNLLAANLKELFPIDVVAVISSRELYLIEKLKVDIIFSTVQIHYTSKPVLIVDPVLNVDSQYMVQRFLEKNIHLRKKIDYQTDYTDLFQNILSVVVDSGGEVTSKLYSQLEMYFRKNNLTINKKEIQPMIKDILEAQHILIHKEVSDWQEAIKVVAEPLLKEEVITENYIDAMINTVKEYGPYIVIGEHIALAHARPTDGSKKLGLSVATLKNSVNFGHEDHDPVNIIFCLSAIDNYSHLNIMKNLIELIHDKDKLKRLAQADTVESFENILYEG